jgi:hypothetical protein
VSSIKYRETIWSDVFPGNFHTVHCLEAAVLSTELALDLSPKQRQRTLWRLDGGSGSEKELHWIVERGYQLVGKGINHHRAASLAKLVTRWDAFGPDWLGEVHVPNDYARPVRIFVKRKRKEDGSFHHTYYVSTLPFASKRLMQTFYNDRGGAEIEQFRNDKSGLGLEARRKYSYLGQKAYIWLTDLTHNLLADFYHCALVDTRFADYGPKRMVRDLLHFPGRLVFKEGRLKRVELLSQKQFADELLMCLVRYCQNPKK